MEKRPNAFQKFIHRFLMLRPVTAVLARILHRADNAMISLTGGRLTVAEFVGLPVIQLTTIGAKTRKPRTLPLVGLPNDGKIALISTNFGKKHNPAWYYNLKTHPECQVTKGGQVFSCRAREVFGQERETYWNLALSYYAGYQKYKERAAPRDIPVVLLEPEIIAKFRI